MCPSSSHIVANGVGVIDVVSTLVKWGGVCYISLPPNKKTDNNAVDVAKLDVVDIFGNTILHYCVIHNLSEMYQHIVDICEADEKLKKKYIDSNFFNTRNEKGFTAFQYATHLKQGTIPFMYVAIMYCLLCTLGGSGDF